MEIRQKYEKSLQFTGFCHVAVKFSLRFYQHNLKFCHHQPSPHPHKKTHVRAYEAIKMKVDMFSVPCHKNVKISQDLQKVRKLGISIFFVKSNFYSPLLSIFSKRASSMELC